VSGAVSLDELHGAYRRTSSRIYRILEDGYDFAVENLIVDTLARDALIVDAAFLVLVFGQVEARFNAIVEARMTTGRERRTPRELGFDRRLNLTLPGVANAELRRDIANWSRIRNDAAHGRELTGGYVMPAIFERAYQLEALLTGQLGDAGEPGEEPR
jgi:hypothetical protein